MNVVRSFLQHVLLISVCCCGAAGCGSKPLESDPAAAKKLLTETLEAWKSGKKPDDLKSQAPPVYVGDPRWSAGAKLVEFNITGEGDFHQSSVRLPVRMKTNKEPKAREVFYWVSTNPANSVTLAE